MNNFKNFIRNDLQFYIFLLVAFFIPLTKEYLPYLMFLWVISGVVTIRKCDLHFSNFQWFLVLIPAVFYVAHVVGMLHTTDFQNGLFDLEMKLSLLFAPLVMVFLTDKVKQNINLVIKAFILGNLIALVICLLRAMDHSFITNEMGQLVFEPSYWSTEQDLTFFQLIMKRYSHFSYGFLSFIHHPSYFAMYVLFAASLIIFLYSKYQHKKSIRALMVLSLLLIFLTLMIWLLGSRAGYLAFIALFLALSLFFMFKTQKFLVSFGVITTGFILMIVFMSPQLKKNLQEVIHQVENKQELTSDSDIRLWLWKSGIEVFQENYVCGVGTGDIKHEMKDKYHQYNLSIAEEKSYNLHNQYLESALKLGVFGLLILSFWLVSTLIYAITTKNFLLFFFMLIVSVHFMFESMLNSIAGVSFFMFFYSLLIGLSLQPRKEKINDR